VDDPDQAVMLPLADGRGDQRGPWWFEPTVSGAVRRYRALVAAVAVTAMAAAVG